MSNLDALNVNVHLRSSSDFVSKGPSCCLSLCPQEADLDILQGALEAEILQPGSSRDRSHPQTSSQPRPAPALPTTLLSLYGRILSDMCYNLPLLQSDFQLRSSALLALTKLMAIDRDYCENNMLVLQACFEPHFDLSGAGTRA